MAEPAAPMGADSVAPSTTIQIGGKFYEAQLLLTQSDAQRQLGALAATIGEQVVTRTDQPIVLLQIGESSAVTAAMLEIGLNLAGYTVDRAKLPATHHGDTITFSSPVGLDNQPFELTGRTIVGVDDVLRTGRTMACALDYLQATDGFMPQSVPVVVLLQQDQRLRAQVLGLEAAVKFSGDCCVVGLGVALGSNAWERQQHAGLWGMYLVREYHPAD